MYRSIWLPIVLCLLFSTAYGQLPAPKVSFVVITYPRSQEGFHTAASQIRLKYTSDARFGPFVVTSHGGDRSYAATVPAGGTGVVDVGFQKEGRHDVYVTVVATRTVTGSQAAAGSPKVPIIFDGTGPSVIAAGQLSGGRIELQGMIVDEYSLPSRLEVLITIDEKVYKPKVMPDGGWRISTDAPPPSRMIDGITVVGREQLDDGSVQQGDSMWISMEELE